jgi:mono/diheme cytochrome c family protein
MMSRLLLVVGLVSVLTGCGKGAGKPADGGQLFSDYCARCHGNEGRPSRAMLAGLGVRDLTAAEVQDGLSDQQIADQIRRGSDNRQMPPFGGVLSDAQIKAVVAHVRTFRQGSPAPTGSHP